MKPVISYTLISYMDPSIILRFIFTLNKAQYFIWIYHVTYYKIDADLSWVHRYYQVVFTNGSNIYIHISTYSPICYTVIHLHLTILTGVSYVTHG